MDYRALASQIAAEEGIDPNLFLRLVNQESRFRPDAVSPKGAMGLAQLMPGTARDLGVDPSDPVQNLRGGARYLRQQLDAFGDPTLALAAYNAGPGNVRKYGGIPPFQETQNYVRTILGGSAPAASTQGGQQMAIMEQQPQGLLGALGIQRRDPTAQGETALPFYQRETFGNTLDNVMLALNSMTLRPDPNLAQQIGQRRQERTTAKQRNATAAWLRSQGREDLAAALESGAITGSDAARVVMTPPKERAGIALGDRIVDPVTGQVIYEPSAEGRPQLDKDQLSALNTIRDDVRAELAPFEIVKSGYNNITTFYENPGSTSDYALAVAFAKILDPGSVAREGEVQAVQNAGARVPALGQALKNAITGEGALTPQVRQEIAELATQIYQERAQAAQTTLGQYSELANRAGIPPEFVYAGQIPEARPVVPSVPPPAALAQGITQQMWDMATPEEKAAWSK